jgi:hypothetical protein
LTRLLRTFKEFYSQAKRSSYLFSREIGELLGLDIEQGEYKRLRTLTGGLDSFGHEVSIKALNIVLDSAVYFAREKGLPRSILSRQGWLRKLRFGLVEYDNPTGTLRCLK